MPRQARKKSESGIYHVVLKGINQQQIFEDAEDYDNTEPPPVLKTGAIIATSSSIITNLVTSSYTPPSISKTDKTGCSPSVSTPSGTKHTLHQGKQSGGTIIAMHTNSNSIGIPKIGTNIRIR